MSLHRFLLPAALTLLATPTLGAQAPAISLPPTTFHPLLPLRPAEGVFAYSRISPDGQILA